MKTFYPRFEVKLFDVVNGSGKERDITKWFGEGCSIRTSKSYREPAGTFTLTFVDKSREVAPFIWTVFSG
ncbi:MAG: hypothetical protein FWC38_02400 [Proteobacteria bacterium]|nr:hypothetical protein [Pseudomonadota bacterium]